MMQIGLLSSMSIEEEVESDVQGVLDRIRRYINNLNRGEELVQTPIPLT